MPQSEPVGQRGKPAYRFSSSSWSRSDRAGGARLAFDSLAIEGGIIGADWLGKLAQLRAAAQEPDDYRIPKGLEIRDEIARGWRIAQACFQDLEAGRASGGDARALAERFLEELLRDAFGFASLMRTAPRTIDDRVYPVRFFALDRVPVVVAPAGAGLDAPLPELGDDHRRRTAFGLLQEVLNASDAALWGIASDGLSLRIARDNASLTRPAWIEADLNRIFTEDLYPDFAALWLLAHESRFGRADAPAATCPLETWREEARQEGTRARDKLSDGFQQALEMLGQGFLSHTANADLRSALHAGELTTDRYFGQLLRLVYRLIFLLTVEERDLLHPKDASASARRLYADGYALRRLRDRAVRRSAHDRHGDLWDAVKIVFRGLAAGEPRLGLPALAGLFAPEQCPELDAAKIDNRAFLGALFHLAWLREPSGLVRVNWRDMGPDELGYVYEGLLELVPQITRAGRSFSFAGADESRGHARKTTGSYYTPDELVQLLLTSALDPVVKRTMDAHPDRPADALLELAIVDPACGSGHFLLAAARRLADHVARIRAGATPTPIDYQRALRDVVRRCIYGVDVIPLAVELCKVSLWMESIDPGLPLTFLESHVRCGNSLIGTTRELMGDQVPDAAWVALEGDDRKVTRSLKRRNREEIAGQRSLLFETRNETDTVRDAMRAVEQAPDTDPSALKEKQRRWKALLASEAYEHEKLVADAWCAAFLWPKSEPGPVVEAAPTTAAWLALRDGETSPSPALVETTRRIAQEYRLFHWELAFPDVVARGGFDVVLGNPPWERVKLQEQEFFASREPSIANARNAAERKKLIAALPATNLVLWKDWSSAMRVAQGQSHFVRQSGRYPLCGKGDVNTYALFAEHNWKALARRGRAGFIVPGGIVSDDTTKEYFQALVDRSGLASVHHFENESLVFKGLHHAYRFVLLTIGESRQADLVFYARRAVDLDDRWRHFALTPTDFATLNPNTRTCPTFRSRRDANINLAMYRRAGVLWREGVPDGNPWGLRFLRMFDMANDSSLFRTRAELAAAGWKLDGNGFERDGAAMLPLYEAKMVYQFDHRFGTYEGQSAAQANQGKLPELDDIAHADPWRVTLPRYWVSQDEVAARLDGTWDRGWLLGWRDIARASDSRTVIACMIPRAAVSDKFLLMMPTPHPQLVAGLYANLLSIPFDYSARQKVGGVSLKYFTMRQLPALPPGAYATRAPWAPSIRMRDWLLPRILELSYTTWDWKAFAEDCGDDGPPFIWDSKRRFLLRCEIDGAFFHLYGMSRDDTAYVLDTFPVLERSETREHGEYWTKRAVLETYDALAAAGEGTPYESPLGPPRRAI
ncbi:MAG: N-6 DNA methylase [Spirochaetaceae bacterium]|nr:N-6 DNA methylase [Spirochaetaceae bacterium]